MVLEVEVAENKRSDQVFQLSLTEIAFTIAFMLLLLLGYLVFREQRDRREAERALQHVQSTQTATEALNAASAKLSGQLEAAGVSNPDDVISKLKLDGEAAAERDRLKLLVQDLEAQISALAEVRQLAVEAGKGSGAVAERVASALALQKAVEQALASSTVPATPAAFAASDAAGKGGAPAASAAPASPKPETAKPPSDALPPDPKVTVAEVTRAIETSTALNRELKKATGHELPRGHEATTASQLVQAAVRMQGVEKSGTSVEKLTKDNADLRGQVAFFKNRLEARGGRDYPPCWADEAGKVEFLFSIELRSDVAIVARAWPERRAEAAAKLPGIDALLARPVALGAFPAAAQPILDWSKRQDPECRHYVQLKSVIADAVQSDRARLMVENFFYKVEARR